MRRVTEVAECFFFTPLGGERLVRKVVFGNLAEAIREGVNKLEQFRCYSVQVISFRLRVPG